MKTVLNIVTYNICACCDFSLPKDENGKEQVSVDHISDILLSFDADVFGLQEVYKSGPKPCYFEQAKKIATKMKYPFYAYAKDQTTKWGNEVDEIGNAVISRYPIINQESFTVLKPNENERRPSENDWYEDRVLLETTIQLPNKRIITFMATHLGLNLLERERMVKTICERLDCIKNPVILVGDFNAKPDNKELLPIHERLTSCKSFLQ